MYPVTARPPKLATPVGGARVRRATAGIIVTVYHLCPAGASGSAFGPYTRLTYWWAERGMLRLVSEPGMIAGDRVSIEAAIVSTIELPSEAERIRAAQDASAEALD